MLRLQKRTYWIRFNSTFFNVVATCGAKYVANSCFAFEGSNDHYDSIVGCYAPNGDHAEKPLENGLKVNAKFISVYEDDPDNPGTPGIEIENVEVLMTDQGLYVYKVSNTISFGMKQIRLILSRFIQMVILMILVLYGSNSSKF